MPVIVVGSDTPAGRRIVEALNHPDREVRAFVSDADAADELRQIGVKVALGDVSDASHVGAASTNCFSAVLVTEAASDERERSFASSPREVLEGWAEAVEDSRVSRVIWVSDGPELPGTGAVEAVSVSIDDPRVVERVVGYDDAADLSALVDD